MPYVANYVQRHNGVLYQKDEVMPLTYAEAQELIKHKAVSLKREKTAPLVIGDEPKNKRSGESK